VPVSEHEEDLLPSSQFCLSCLRIFSSSRDEIEVVGLAVFTMIATSSPTALEAEASGTRRAKRTAERFGIFITRLFSEGESGLRQQSPLLCHPGGRRKPA
jgi:hypothetical protein